MSFVSTLSSRDTYQAHYVYDLEGIRTLCQSIASFHSPLFQARYAMKANPHPDVMALIKESGLRIDCCSEYEADDAIALGFAPESLQVSSQQCPRDWARLYDQGIDCVATSLRQLERFGQQCPHGSVGVRINPGQGSGTFARVNTGGQESSFGIWHEYISQITEIATTYDLTISKLHIHIGSGSDTQVWLDTLGFCLSFVEQFPHVSILNMGGGFKVGRIAGEKTTDLTAVIAQSLEIIRLRSERTGRELRLEIEPGTYIVANYGYIVCQADDIVDTGEEGYRFVRTNTGMDMIIRPAMYGAQHPIYHFSQQQQQRSQQGPHEYVIVGHCCESSDILTPQPGNPDAVATRGFDQEIAPGDMIVIGGAGAYCESMRCVGYNGYRS